MKAKFVKAALTAGLFVAASAPASAASVLSTAATDPYSGPTPTFDFETSQPAVHPDANIVSGSDGTRAQPFGSTGNYLSVGPTEGSPVLINLLGFDAIGSISLLWGSIDDYNILQLLDGGGGVFQTIVGADVLGAGGTFGERNGSLSNRLVTITLNGAERNISGLRLISNTNAFEIDNVTVGVVPEPATWAMMIGGFGLVGFTLRRRRRASRLALA